MKPSLPLALRELGPAALLRFGQYRIALDSGWIRRKTPLYEWDDRPLASWLTPGANADPKIYSTYRNSAAPRLFLPEPTVLRAQLSVLVGRQAGAAIAAADRIAEGSFALFGFNQSELGFPPDWHSFAPLVDTDFVAPALSSKHWSDIDLLKLPSDVKLLWEVNRFGWVFPLARAYVLTGDSKYFEIFWKLFEDWRANNPPNLGLNWYSGQEVSIRMLSLIFALYAMQADFASHPERVVDIAQAIAVHAARIPPTLSYAVAQGNNHLLVEAVGLYSAGILFPEFRQAENWKRIGSRWLMRALRKQVFADGGYVQHSINYHRMALQAALWAARLAELQGEPMRRPLLDRIKHMTSWLGALVDPTNGAVPNYGPNDGAEPVPFCMLPFDDHRPTVQASSRMLWGETCYVPGGWDEWSLWLGVLEEEWANSQPRTAAKTYTFPDSGLFLLGGENSRAIFRASRFKSRPGHADQLHLDLWLGEVNIAKDAGSYLYNAKSPWDNALSGSRHHNTLLVDDSEAMIRAGRFLWLNWNQARVVGHWRTQSGGLEVFSAERPGDLNRQITHRRTVIRAGDRHWTVVDDLLGDGKHRADLNWLLPDLPWTLEAAKLQLDSPVGAVKLTIDCEGGQYCLYRAGACVLGDPLEVPEETLGWFSPTYALKIPALQFVCSCQTTLPLRIKSHWKWLDVDQDSPRLGWVEPYTREVPVEWVRLNDELLEISDAYFVDPSSFRRAG